MGKKWNNALAVKKKKSIFLEDKEGTILFFPFFSLYCLFLNQKEDSRVGESSFRDGKFSVYQMVTCLLETYYAMNFKICLTDES